MTTIRHQDGATALLATAAAMTETAPSLVIARPWRCRVERAVLRLYAEPSPRLATLDADRRAEIMSCGVALHHAYTVIRAAGHDAAVRRLPDPAKPDLLAEVRVGGRCEPERDVLRQHGVIVTRRTEAPVGHQSPSVRTLAELQTVSERCGAHLLLLRDDQRAELAAVVPAGSRSARSALERAAHDESAAYALLYGDADDPHGWLRGGEALSAVSLTAADDRLAAVPVGPPLATATSRGALVALTGVRHPYLVLRLAEGPPRRPAAGRRAADPAASEADVPRPQPRRRS